MSEVDRRFDSFRQRDIARAKGKRCADNRRRSLADGKNRGASLVMSRDPELVGPVHSKAPENRVTKLSAQSLLETLVRGDYLKCGGN
jgi:hypothetical protein